MAELLKQEYAYLFEKILEAYVKELKVNGLEISKNETQNSILGIGSSLADNENNKITSSTNSISHVIYYTLCKKYYPREVKGFPVRNNLQEGLLFQGADLYKGFRSYNSGDRLIKTSDKYLEAYLDFLGITRSQLSELAGDENYKPPAKLKLFHTLQKPRKQEEISSGNDYTFDIFLASPKLTLGRKIDVYFKNFEKRIKDKMAKEIIHQVNGEISEERVEVIIEKVGEEIGKEMIRLFFGTFLDLEKEYDIFEEYIDGLYKKLNEMGFRVYNSRQGMSKDHVRNFGKAGDQLKKDKKIIAKSRAYVLVAPYPRLFTSAWLEAGITLGFEKPCIFICRDRTDDLLWVLQNDSKELGIEIIEYREYFDDKLSDRIDLIASRIAKTTFFRCDACALEEGVDGYIGDQQCPNCHGKGYHPRG